MTISLGKTKEKTVQLVSGELNFAKFFNNGQHARYRDNRRNLNLKFFWKQENANQNLSGNNFVMIVNGTTFSELPKLHCTPPNHIFNDNVFECQYSNCSMKPYICRNCSYKSVKNLQMILCKLCKVTERMENFD